MSCSFLGANFHTHPFILLFGKAEETYLAFILKPQNATFPQNLNCLFKTQWKLLDFEWSPPYWWINWSQFLTYHLEVCWHISSEILSWHSIWHYFLAFYLASILTFYSGILSSILSGILSGILSDIVFSHSIRHLFWHSLSLTCVEVQQCPLRSGARGWGPAVPTAGARNWGPAVHTEIWSSQLRSGTYS